MMFLPSKQLPEQLSKFTHLQSATNDINLMSAMSSKDSHLYNQPKARNLKGGKEISSATTISFTSQLSSLINSSNTDKSSKTPSGRARSKKEDIFATHNRNLAKRAKRDLEPDNAGTFEQKHTTKGEALDDGVWQRSKRKMEEKARLYAAMKRGDIEDGDERYAVDFDAKWAEARAEGKEDDSDDDDHEEKGAEEVEYIDEFGRTRKGTKLDALRAKQQMERQTESIGARPNVPDNIIYGDAIQHNAFDLDEPRAAQMEELARKRDKSLTPPPEEHFDGNREIRTKGAGFYQFSGDSEERKQQMENLERDRAETERMRKERDTKMADRKAQIEARRQQIQQRNAKRKADEFLADLGAQVDNTPAEQDDKSRELRPGETNSDMLDRIEKAIRREEEYDEGQALLKARLDDHT